MMTSMRLVSMFVAAIVSLAFFEQSFGIGQQVSRVVLEDFRVKGENGLPPGWKAQRSEEKAKESYSVRIEDGAAFLSAKGADQRVFKKIPWDPKASPVITWRWRLRSAPAGVDPIAAVYVALDTDLMLIPVLTKYVWSATKPEGTIIEGGIFTASEIVIQSGTQPIGEWVEERVNAYEDFKRIHKHEPAEKAWGISLLGGPGVEVDFGPIIVMSPRD